MPLVPSGGANLGAYGQGQMTQTPASPGMGNLLMAAAVQAQDPNRSMPEGQDRPRFPAAKLKRKVPGMLKTRQK